MSSRASHDQEMPDAEVEPENSNSNGGQNYGDETATMDGNDGTVSIDEDVDNGDVEGENDGDTVMRNDGEGKRLHGSWYFDLPMFSDMLFSGKEAFRDKIVERPRAMLCKPARSVRLPLSLLSRRVLNILQGSTMIA